HVDALPDRRQQGRDVRRTLPAKSRGLGGRIQDDLELAALLERDPRAVGRVDQLYELGCRRRGDFRRRRLGAGCARAERERQDRKRQVPHYLSPAAARSVSALSVASQVNSGSSRPKWPYAAVLR